MKSSSNPTRSAIFHQTFPAFSQAQGILREALRRDLARSISVPRPRQAVNGWCTRRPPVDIDTTDQWPKKTGNIPAKYGLKGLK